MSLAAHRSWTLFVAIIATTFMPHLATADDKLGFSTVHLAEAERLVYALGVAESLSIPSERAIQQVRRTDPARADLMLSVMEPFLEKRYVGLELRGFMANHFDVDTCRELSRFWEGPVGRKFVDAQVQLLSTGKAPELKFTPAEQAMRKRFEQTDAFRQFSRVQPLMQERFAQYVKDTKEKMMEKMKEELARRDATAGGKKE